MPYTNAIGSGAVGRRGRLAVRPARIRRMALPPHLPWKLWLAAKPQRTAVLTGYLSKKTESGKSGAMVRDRWWWRSFSGRGSAQPLTGGTETSLILFFGVRSQFCKEVCSIISKLLLFQTEQVWSRPNQLG